MADRELKHWQKIFIAVVVLTVPFIIAFQLTYQQPDININTGIKPPENQCIYGQDYCKYVQENIGKLQFDENEDMWIITGNGVWCVKVVNEFAEPVANPANQYGNNNQLSCNDIAIFNKSEWDLSLQHADLVSGGYENTFFFTKKGVILN